MSHCLDRDREMRVIRYTDCNSIDLVGHLVEHLAEILETRNFREHGNKFLSMRCTHIYITKCNHFAQTGFIQFLCDLASTVTDTDKSDSHFFVGTDKGTPGMALALDGIQKKELLPQLKGRLPVSGTSDVKYLQISW